MPPHTGHAALFSPGWHSCLASSEYLMSTSTECTVSNKGSGSATLEKPLRSPYGQLVVEVTLRR
jgi:hypothetical protein